MIFTIRFVALLIAAGHLFAATSTASEPTNTHTESIRFIALPYLHISHIDQHGQMVFISHEKNQQELAEQQWQLIITSIPALRTSGSRIQTLDVEFSRDVRIAPDHSIIIPIPKARALAGPLKARASDHTALWLQFLPAKPEPIWQTPSLLPMAYAKLLQEQQRKARLAEKMADRAFYFGYDENNDALK
ncbi:MAG: hypothetical protein ACE5E3_06250 [Mariprofundus sp.]